MTYNFQAIPVEICQYIEVCGQCISAIHVLVISASPEKRLAFFYNFQSLHVYSTGRQSSNFFFWKISTYYGRQINIGCKIRSRITDVGTSPADDIFRLCQTAFSMVSNATVPTVSKLMFLDFYPMV